MYGTTIVMVVPCYECPPRMKHSSLMETLQQYRDASRMPGARPGPGARRQANSCGVPYTVHPSPQRDPRFTSVYVRDSGH